MDFTHLKRGHTITRLPGGEVAMPMRVLRVDSDVLYCVPREMTPNVAVRRNLIWTFDRASGAEIGDFLRWGPAYGITGSFLVPNTDPRAPR
jgi:hypothetical protein